MIQPDDRAEAMGQLYKLISERMESNAKSGIWNPNNPIGTEHLKPQVQQSVGMPDPSFRPGVLAGGGTTPMSAEQIDAFREGSVNLYDQASLLGGGGLLGRVGGGSVSLASRRPLANPPPTRGVLNIADPIRGIEDVVSTRVPWAKQPKNAPPLIDPHQTPDMVINLDATKQAPDAYGKNAMALRSDVYPDLPLRGMRNPDAMVEKSIDHMADNLVWLHGQQVEKYGQKMVDDSSRWYDGAHQIAHAEAEANNLEPRQVAGAMAALSPQKNWYENADLQYRRFPNIETATTRVVGARDVRKSNYRLPGSHNPG